MTPALARLTRPLADTRGMTLAEILVALVIISIGLVGLASVVPLSSWGIQEGNQMTTSVFLADRLEEQGATHVTADVWEEKVVVDERLVTGQNPASAAGVAKEMEKLLAEVIHQEKAEEQHEAEALRAEKDAEKSAKKSAAAGTEH